MLGSGPGGNWRGLGPVEYRGNQYIPSVYKSTHASVPPPTGLLEAGQGLSETGSSLSEAGSGLSKASSGLSKASSGPSEDSSGVSDWSCLSDACHGSWLETVRRTDGCTYGRDIEIPIVFYMTLSTLVPSWAAALLE